MRHNPSFTLEDMTEIRRVIENNPWATIISNGGDGLIASHYAVLLDDSPAVPTWNYTAVHLSGVPEIMSDEENLEVLDRLVAHFESRMSDPRMMWERPNDPEYVRGHASGTVGFRLTPTRVVAKRKLSQNKPPEVVESVISFLSGDGPYAHPELADEMRRAQKPQTEEKK